jgi:hypothetical protein
MTSAPGHETPAAGPITVINVFEVPAGQVGEFIARWRVRPRLSLPQGKSQGRRPAFQYVRPDGWRVGTLRRLKALMVAISMIRQARARSS